MNTVTHRLTMTEWQQHDPQSAEALRGVFFADGEVAALAQKLTRDGKLRIEERRQGLAVAATSFVGKLTLGQLELTIQPKISGLPLLTLLRYAFGLRQLQLPQSAAFSTAANALQELLAQQLATEAEHLLSRGLARSYQARSETLTLPRGRIDMQRLASRGGGATLDLPCVWHPRTDDCLVNQILHQGLLLAARISDEPTLRSHLRRLAALLDATVTPLTLDWRVLRRHRREANRLVAAYEPAITLIGLLLEAQGAALTPGQEELRLPGFLFDMNKLFETLLGRFLREHLVGYAVQEQYQLHGLFAYEPAHNPHKRAAPTPRPDYVVRKDGQAIAMLDAKYRDLWKRELPRDMLYQLAIYALSGGAGDRATILYPTLDGAAREARIQITHPLRGSPIGRVILRPVRLDRLAELLQRPMTIQVQRERTAFAHELAFGTEILVT